MKVILDKLHKSNIMNQSKKFILWIFVVSCFSLIVNLVKSQDFPQLFYKLLDNDKNAATVFLQTIRYTGVFNNQLNYFVNIFGSTFKSAVFSKEIDREVKIKKLEQILVKSPYSRDVLYGLYKLHLEKNNKITAEKYLKAAKEVDPNIK